MFDFAFLTKSTDYYEKDKEYESVYCTNPIESEEVKTTSWLDDYGWI